MERRKEHSFSSASKSWGDFNNVLNALPESTFVSPLFFFPHESCSGLEKHK